MLHNRIAWTERRRRSRRIDTRRHHRVPTLRLIPNSLHTKLTLVQRPINAQLDRKRFNRKLRRPVPTLLTDLISDLEGNYLRKEAKGANLIVCLCLFVALRKR